ncbi:MAG TPA: triose-phosphate isomerase [Thermoplasmata archaeon]|nr:triose-phosphate isomerase [Thermoplasmata archaeon]
MGNPLFLLNLKVYPGTAGPAAERIAAVLEELGAAHGVAVAIAPAMPDVGRLAAQVALPVVAQHVDPFEPGAHTGFVTAEALRAAGARGSLVNHSEHPLTRPEVGEAVQRLQAAGLAAVVCAGDVEPARVLAEFHPAYLAVEPPELIGGDLSVSTARPEIVGATADVVHTVSPTTQLLCGAGIHDRADVSRALELGSEGVLVASAVTRARDPRAAIEELLSGF